MIKVKDLTRLDLANKGIYGRAIRHSDLENYKKEGIDRGFTKYRTLSSSHEMFKLLLVLLYTITLVCATDGQKKEGKKLRSKLNKVLLYDNDSDDVEGTCNKNIS